MTALLTANTFVFGALALVLHGYLIYKRGKTNFMIPYLSGLLMALEIASFIFNFGL